MKIHRPLWNEGALLSPQQFQQQSEWDAFSRAGIAARGNAFPWGVGRVELDDAMLASGRVQAQSLRLWLPDDTLVDTRFSDLPPEPREIEAPASAGNVPVTVYVALPVMQAGIVNVQTDTLPAERPLRYREAWETIADRFGQEEESMAVARFNLAFRFGHEDNGAWDICAIARLLQDGQGGWRQDTDFIPPMALFSASRNLCERLALLNRQLRSRRQRLMSMRRESNDRMADFAVADRPYIAHAFHDSEHPDVVTRDNRSQNILRTASQNELRMEDQRQSEHIALSTPFGATALNQGHIVDTENEPRGTGFELRTDEYGVIRVAKGLLITTDGQAKAVGDVLSQEEALREIEAGYQRLERLAEAERQALALEVDVASQVAMFNERLKPLNEVIHFTALEGMAFTSDEHLQLAATDNIAMNAGRDISTGSMGNTAVLAGKQLGLFAQNGKLSVISDQGPIQVQAQNDALHLGAAQKLSISSMSDILFAGKKKVTLIGGGSYLLIEAGRIEYGTPHTYTRNVKRTRKLRPAGQDIAFPLMGTSHIYSAVYLLQDEQGRILADIPYHLRTPSGQEASGFSDAEGRTVAVYTREQEAVDLHVVPDKPQPEESMWFIGDGDQQQLTTEFREDV